MTRPPHQLTVVCEPTGPARSLLRQICQTYRQQFEQSGIELDLDLDDAPITAVSAGWLKVLMGMLFERAQHVMPAGGLVYVTAVRTARGLEIEVSDSSDQLPTRTRGARGRRNEPPHVDPGYQRIEGHVRMMAGHVEVRRCAEGGYSITVVLPHAQQQRAAA